MTPFKCGHDFLVHILLASHLDLFSIEHQGGSRFFLELCFGAWYACVICRKLNDCVKVGELVLLIEDLSNLFHESMSFRHTLK